VGVTFYEETLDVSCTAVTPPCSKGALGTWRSQCGARTQCREHAALEARTSLWVNQRWRGVCMSVLELRRESGKAHEGKPRSEPDWGKPTVRDRRGACGNVVAIGSRTEDHRETDGNTTGPYGCRRAAFLSRPLGVVGDDQPDAGDGKAGRLGVAERLVVPMKPGNAGGGKHLC
jgi:hypothetical protein